MSESLWQWWDGVLTEERRRALEAVFDLDVPASLAVEILRISEPLNVLETHVDPSAPHGIYWRLTPEVAQFVGWREHERRHPEEYHQASLATRTALSAGPSGAHAEGMNWLLECPVCGKPLSRTDDDPDAPLDCPSGCRRTTSEDDWVAARWSQFEANR